MVARPVPQQEVCDAEPALGARARAPARARPAAQTSLTENFRPGTLERWNLGFERIPGGESEVILARVSGLGHTGPSPSAQGSPRSPGDGRASATSTAFPASRRPACTSRLATRWPECSPRKGSSPRSPGLKRRRGARGQRAVEASLLAAPSFALLESTVPEYDRLGIVRGPGRHRPPGRCTFEHLQVARRQMDGDRGECVTTSTADSARRWRSLSSPTMSDSQRTSPAASTRRSSRASSPSGRQRHDAGGDRPHPQRGRGDLRTDLHGGRRLRETPSFGLARC